MWNVNVVILDLARQVVKQSARECDEREIDEYS